MQIKFSSVIFSFILILQPLHVLAQNVFEARTLESLTPKADAYFTTNSSPKDAGSSKQLLLGGTQNYALALNFDKAQILSALTGQILESATLELQITGRTGKKQSGLSSSISKVSNSWTEKLGTSAKPKLPKAGAQINQTNINTTTTKLVFDLTADINALSSNSNAKHFGWLVKLNRKIKTVYKIGSRESSSRPKLILKTHLNDKTAPQINVSSPASNFNTAHDSLLIVGQVVDSSPVTISANNIAGQVSNNNFLIEGIPLTQGLNNIQIRAVDSFGNSSTKTIQVQRDSLAPAIIIIQPSNYQTTNLAQVRVFGFVGEPNVTAYINGTQIPINGFAFDQSNYPLNEGPNLITVSVRDSINNYAAESVLINRDSTAPQITITDPKPLSSTNTNQIIVSGTVDDPNASVSVNGVAASISANTYSASIVLANQGVNTINVVASDLYGNTSSTNMQINYAVPLEISITNPANNQVFNQPSLNLSGTAGFNVSEVRVNSVLANLNSGSWDVNIPIREGSQIITAVASNSQGQIGTASLQIVKDTVAPTVTIISATEGQTYNHPTINVVGMVNDLLVGTVNQAQASVYVNGIQASVSNRSFVVTGVNLYPGINTLNAIATDHAGNVGSSSVSINYQANNNVARIQSISGDLQSAVIGNQLPMPITVGLVDANNQPVANQAVVFRIKQNNGALSASAGAISDQESLVIQTDASGIAQAYWTLGSRAGAGNQMLEATATGFNGKVTFCATGLTSSAFKVNVDSGNMQSGVPNYPLAAPFVVAVTDGGHNRVAGVPVTFTVKEGGGHFNGQESLTINSDSDGRAAAVLVLGMAEGRDNNLVEVSFANNPTSTAVFSASALVATDPAQTKVSGVVLDNSNNPISGVTLSIEGTDLTAVSDQNGQFELMPAPVGHVHLIADGSTAQPLGTWVKLAFELRTIAGRNNTIGMPIFLVQMDLEHAIPISPTQGGVVTLPQMPGFALEVAPNSVTFPDGTKTGMVSATIVHPDKGPMPPNFGQQPRLLFSIGPAGAVFNPPARLTLPNIDGLTPGEVTDLYSFDHDQGTFVSIGTGTVSADGQVVKSDPGVGILKGAWHCGGNPATTGSAGTCPFCYECKRGACEVDSGKNGSHPPEQPCHECDDGNIVQSDFDNEGPGCCDGNIYDTGSQDCCRGELNIPFTSVTLDKQGIIYNTQAPTKQCCGKSGVLDNPNMPFVSTEGEPVSNYTYGFVALLPSLKSTIMNQRCPEFHANNRENEYDGCSVPEWLAYLPTGAISLLPGLSSDKDNPAGGSATHFSHPCTGLSDEACYNAKKSGAYACDYHDTCYQECTLTSDGHSSCDASLGSIARSRCVLAAEIDGISVAVLCYFFADLYQDILEQVGSFAYWSRQEQYCDCCH